MVKSLATLLLVLPFVGCVGTVDQTEHCIRTRYGQVKDEHMSSGLHWMGLSDLTCFSLTEQNFPQNGDVETMEAQTADPITITGDVALVFSYNSDAVYNTFLDKRSDQAAKIEVMNAIREGYRTAIAGWTVAQIFSERRAALSDSVQGHIQRKLGSLATVHKVFVRNITIPKPIEEARIAAAQQAQVLDRAQKQYIIDSVNARAKILTATADAESKRLEAAAYQKNPALLQVRVAEALAKTCSGTQTCVLGGSIADVFGRVRQ